MDLVPYGLGNPRRSARLAELAVRHYGPSAASYVAGEALKFAGRKAREYLGKKANEFLSSGPSASSAPSSATFGSGPSRSGSRSFGMRRTRRSKRSLRKNRGNSGSMSTSARGRRKVRPSRRRRSGKGHNLLSRVRQLEKTENATIGTQHVYNGAVLYFASTPNAIAYGSLGNNVTTLQSVIAGLWYFNPSAPGTPVQATLAGTGYSKKILFDRTVHTLTLRSNYKATVDATIYVCTPRTGTNITAATAITDGKTEDLSGSTYTTQNIFHRPSWSSEFNELWKIQTTFKRRFEIGEEASFRHVIPSYYYDPAQILNETEAYQKNIKGTFTWLIRIQGVLGHLTAATTPMTTVSAMDCWEKGYYRLKYDAGLKIVTRNVLTTGLTTWTTGNVMEADMGSPSFNNYATG
nr:MAG: capsid protein [Cressdnaviricota sp.]